MTLQEAKNKISEVKNLIGKPNMKGFVIDYIIPVPSDSNLQVQFLSVFLNTLDFENAISPYTNEDMDVWAIEIKHYKESGVLFYEKIA